MSDKKQVTFDELLLEDLLYIGCVRSMQLKYSSPKFIVSSDDESSIFYVHCVFPFAGSTGAIVDVEFDTNRIEGKTLREALDELTELQREIMAKVTKQTDKIQKYLDNQEE